MRNLAATRKGSDPSGRGALSGEQRDPALKIAIVDESPIRAAILEDGLREAGFVHVERIAETHSLLARIYAMDPDVILIDLENPSRDMLEQMFQMSRAVKRPVAMFVDQSDSASIQASVDAGVSAYIVDGLKKERITSILDLCISRFNAFSRLQGELDQAKDALEERKVIDRAKGVLMKAKSCSNERKQASHWLHPAGRRHSAAGCGRHGICEGARGRHRIGARGVMVECSRQAQYRPVRCGASAVTSGGRVHPRPWSCAGTARCAL
jgi:response regulator NasT